MSDEISQDEISGLLDELRAIEPMNKGGYDPSSEHFSTISVRNHERAAQLHRVINALLAVRTSPKAAQDGIASLIRDYDRYGRAIHDRYLIDYGVNAHPDYSPPVRDELGKTLIEATGNDPGLQRDLDVRSGRLRNAVITLLRRSRIACDRDPEQWLI